MRDYYDVLGVSPDAGADEIQRAYRQLTRRYHPDISGEERGTGLREVTRAYDVLRDGERRRSYDARLASMAHGGTDCLADEVAIDFPSVATVLDRMRHAFFGDPPPPPRGPDIVVTSHEAFWGTTRPLRVPVRRTCPQCGGRGEVWAEWCAACCGVGDLPGSHEVRLCVPAGVQHGTRVRFRVAAPGIPETVVDARIMVR